MEVQSLSPNWLELPRDVTENIIQRLDTIQIVTRVCYVCPLWWKICKDPSLWRSIHLKKPYDSPYDLVKICHYAIQQSCGLLEDISIEDFGTDDLLKFIAKNSRKLRRLRLLNCSGISDDGLIDAMKHFSLLEEFDISLPVNGLSHNTLVVIGLSCPLLKTLKYSRLLSFDRSDYYFDEEAFAIAQTMPQLRHLDIYVNLVTDAGLLDILDGCLVLESLKIDCFQKSFSDCVRKRCQEQIKSFRLSFYYDPVNYDD